MNKQVGQGLDRSTLLAGACGEFVKLLQLVYNDPTAFEPRNKDHVYIPSVCHGGDGGVSPCLGAGQNRCPPRLHLVSICPLSRRRHDGKSVLVYPQSHFLPRGARVNENKSDFVEDSVLSAVSPIT